MSDMKQEEIEKLRTLLQQAEASEVEEQQKLEEDEPMPLLDVAVYVMNDGVEKVIHKSRDMHAQDDVDAKTRIHSRRAARWLQSTIDEERVAKEAAARDPAMARLVQQRWQFNVRSKAAKKGWETRRANARDWALQRPQRLETWKDKAFADLHGQGVGVSGCHRCDCGGCGKRDHICVLCQYNCVVHRFGLEGRLPYEGQEGWDNFLSSGFPG